MRYLWPARTLFFWRRDLAIVERRVTDPCFGNLYDPAQVVVAGGSRGLDTLARAFAAALRSVPRAGGMDR